MRTEKQILRCAKDDRQKSKCKLFKTESSDLDVMSDVSGFLIPAGFRFAAVKAGLKASGRTDFAVIVRGRNIVTEPYNSIGFWENKKGYVQTSKPGFPMMLSCFASVVEIAMRFLMLAALPR